MAREELTHNWAPNLVMPGTERSLGPREWPIRQLPAEILCPCHQVTQNHEKAQDFALAGTTWIWPLEHHAVPHWLLYPMFIEGCWYQAPQAIGG